MEESNQREHGDGLEETPQRLPYVPPTVELKGTLASSTLVSGDECVFDPPPC